ncbi:hypothetical protein BRAS3843_1130009 [Bradyrhizobium sp. STM 3843]|uniref:hypothetical protein n=1 Tax=Bradyrhizobium sp. STM 3843 TaxID=551947 RepID=UPI00024066AE|nr:hypothetical protein [Bradyrhizobium sp. STM 3843]CCE04778.1 hypothetical protein BRAS3843_1130009 [Bradyrhizobium sp. STM 3843]
MVTPKKPPGETPTSSEKYFELHEYIHPADTTEGLIERIIFALGRAWFAIGGDLREVRVLARRAIQHLAKSGFRDCLRQQRLAALIACYNATPDPTDRKVAAIVTGSKDAPNFDAVRKDIERARHLDAAGQLNPAVTDGSSVNIPPPPWDRDPRK